jgi:gas vesicle protein
VEPVEEGTILAIFVRSDQTTKHLRCCKTEEDNADDFVTAMFHTMRPYAKKYSSPKSRQTTKNIGQQLTTDMQVEL